MPAKKRSHLPDDYTHLEDMAMKTAAQYFGEELLVFFGIQQKVKRTAPTEVLHLEARQMYEDFNYEMEGGGWYHFEFESDRVSVQDLRRFREYEAATSRTYHVPVTTFVVCSAKVKNPLSELKEGINTYRVRTVILKEEDADRVFRQLQEKNADDIGRTDLLPVILSPLMSGGMTQKERILKGAGYLKNTYKKIPGDELDKMEAVLYALAVKFLNEAELKEVKEAMVMTKLGQMLVEDGRAKGMEQGIAAGQAGMIHCIRRKHEKNYEASVIAEILEQKIEYVKKICQLIEENPECTDIEIARKYLACEEETDIK